MNWTGLTTSSLHTSAVILFLLILPIPSASDHASKQSGNGKSQQPAIEQQIKESYGKLPLSFEANQGQAAPQIKFISRGSGYTLFLTRSAETVLLLSKPREGKPDMRQAHMANQEKPLSSAVRIKPVAANATPLVEGLDELPGKVNYFRGNDPSKWRTDVPIYTRVKYRSVYPGVDLVYYGNQRRLEHDFIVAPGADPAAIKLRFEGAEKISLDPKGNLVLATTDGEIRVASPVIYQQSGGVRQDITGRYTLDGHDRVGFEVAAYDTSRPLVIDPVLVYSTYLGGGGSDEGLAIAVDAAGSAYVTGVTGSSDFPTTAGAFDTTLSGVSDAFVTKLNATGNALVYSTFLGGSGRDDGLGIAVDAAGLAYVTGVTGSSDFPTTAGAFDATSGGRDAFVTKLNATGNALVYSTFLGGSGGDDGLGIAVAAAGSAYVTGETSSSDFPTTPGSFDGTFGGMVDRFVTKLNATGSELAYSTFLGGSEFDEGRGIAVDAAGSAYVTGRTTSSDFPTTAGAFDTTLSGADAFVTKLNATGNALVYSTFLGGSGGDDGVGIAVDAAGSAYVTGFTDSSDFPTTAGAFDTTIGRFTDGFITKLNATGNALVYSTFLGGSGDEGGRAVAVDAAGSAYVTGFTSSSDFPTTAGTFDATFGGIFDGFVTKLNATGSALAYSTFLGGSGGDDGLGIAVDVAGSAYITGDTSSSDFPTTPRAFDTTFGGFSDGFVTKIAEALTSTPGKVTGGGLIQPDGTVSPATLLIRFGNNATVSSKATFGFNVRFTGGFNPTGNLTYKDRSAGVRIKALSFSLLVIGDGACGPRTHAQFIGSANVSGASGTSTQNFEAEADDCGQAGSSPSPDIFRITTMGTTSYAAAGPVLGGNIQIHKN